MTRRFLGYPQTDQPDLDDPITTEYRRKILAENAYLQKVYRGWYVEIQAEVPEMNGAVLELGSGAGFLKEYLPALITSELLSINAIDLVANATALPFASASLRAIVMTNVLHHIPRVGCFFEEAARCLTAGGKVILIEPWITGWSRFIYSHLHHEPIDPEAVHWDFEAEGPVSSANEALPWIVFSRDQAKFEADFPQLHITRREPFMPVHYLLSGGFTSRFHFPGWSYSFWTRVENLSMRWRERFAMFAIVVVTKQSNL